MKNSLLNGIRKAAGWQYPVIGGSVGALAALPFAIPRFKEKETAKGIGILGAGATAGTALGLLANRIAVNRIIKANKEIPDYTWQQALDNAAPDRFLSRAPLKNTVNPWNRIDESDAREKIVSGVARAVKKGKEIKGVHGMMPKVRAYKQKGMASIEIPSSAESAGGRIAPYILHMPIRSRKGLAGEEIVDAIIRSNQEHVAAGGLFPGQRLTFDPELLEKLKGVRIKI